MLNQVNIDKEKYLDKSKADRLKEYILKPSNSVLRKKASNINEIVRKMALNRK